MTRDRTQLTAIPVRSRAVAGPSRANHVHGFLVNAGEWSRTPAPDLEALSLYHDLKLHAVPICSAVIPQNFEVLTERDLQADRMTKRTQQLERELREAREQIRALVGTRVEFEQLRAEVDGLADFIHVLRGSVK